MQKYYLRNPETSLKKARNNPEKLRENKKSASSMGIKLRNHGTGSQDDNHYTIWGLKLCRQKDNISVDSRLCVNKVNCEYPFGKCLKVKIEISSQ